MPSIPAPVYVDAPVDLMETHQDQALNIGKPNNNISLPVPSLTLKSGYVYDYCGPNSSSRPFICTHVGLYASTVMYLDGTKDMLETTVTDYKKVANSIEEYIDDLIEDERYFRAK